MSDGFDFLKQFWGQAAASATNTPPLNPLFGGSFPAALGNWAVQSLNVEELDKKIADLKSVEQWLTLNMNMLRGSIQALEVQRATIATLQSFSQNMGDMAGDVASAFKAQAEPKKTSDTAPEPVPPTNPGPTPHFIFPGGLMPNSDNADSNTDSDSDEDATPPQAASHEDTDAENNDSASPNTAPAANAAGLGMPDWSANLANATQWWNQLQGQFKQVAESALAAQAANAAAAEKLNAAASSPAKPRSQSSRKANPAAKPATNANESVQDAHTAAGNASSKRRTAAKKATPKKATTKDSGSQVGAAKPNTSKTTAKPSSKAISTAQVNTHLNTPGLSKEKRPPFTVARSVRDKK